jgi:hypothetical protein
MSHRGIAERGSAGEWRYRMRASASWIACLSSLTLAAFGCSSGGNNSGDNNPGNQVDSGTGADETSTPADTGAAADTTSTPPDAAPAYPPPPYGLDKGSTFPLITLKGYRGGLSGDGSWVDISTTDYYDPTGAKGFTGIYFVDAAQWCGPCNEEAYNLGTFYSKSYKARGAVFATAVIEDSSQKAATQNVTNAWMTGHHINFDTMLDPHGAVTLPHTGTVGLPHNYVIDPRTMKITAVIEGYDPYITKCTKQADCCDPSQNANSAGCCDPNDSTCTNPCPCPPIPSGGTAADVTWSCNATIGYCIEPATHGAIDELETTMVANGAKPLVP